MVTVIGPSHIRHIKLKKTTQLPFISLITLITMLIIAQPLLLLWIISPNSESAQAWVPVHEGVPLRPFDMQLAASSSVEPVRSSRQNSCSRPDCPFHRSVFDLAGDTGEGARYLLLSGGAGTRSSLPEQPRTSSSPRHRLRNSQRSNQGLPARRESSGRDLASRWRLAEEDCREGEGTGTRPN